MSHSQKFPNGSVMAHKGILAVVLAGLIFTAYAFNLGDLQIIVDNLFSQISRWAQAENNVVVRAILAIAPYVGVLVVGLVVYAILRGLFRGTRNITREVRLSRRESLTLHEFVRLAASHGISSKVSHEAYRLLLPCYRGEMRVQFDDHLERDLHLSLHDSIQLYAILLRRSDRVLRALDDKSMRQPETVFELLKAANAAPPRAAMPQSSRLRSAARHLSFIRPVSKQ